MIGHARAFLNAIRLCTTELCRAFEPAHAQARRDNHRRLNALDADLFGVRRCVLASVPVSLISHLGPACKTKSFLNSSVELGV